MENYAKFAISDDLFGRCCTAAGLPATKRQASKFCRGKGKAYTFLDTVKKALDSNQVNEVVNIVRTPVIQEVKADAIPTGAQSKL